MVLSKKIYIFIIAALTLGGIFILINFIKSPATKTLNEFLSSINDSSKISLNDYLLADLHADPFLVELMDREIIIGHKMQKSQRINDKSVKIKVSLDTKEGSIDVKFVLSKIDNRWLITQFPKTTYIEAAVPLMAEEKGNSSIEYQMDIDGTHLSCIFPSQNNDINMGLPASLLLVEDYIVIYQHMIPIHLDKIMSASEKHIEDSQIGYIPIESSLKIYSIEDDIPVYDEKSILPIGITNVILYHSPSTRNKTLIAYIDPSKMPNNKIRVVLNNTEYDRLIHDEISLSSTKGLTIKNLIDGFEYSIEKDEEIVFNRYGDDEIQLYHQGEPKASSQNRWYITPKNGGNIVINSIKRAQSLESMGTPYRGSIEISKDVNGMVLINEVDMEEYLYTVVPSEMPIKFGLESLKVQAIAARSYAVRCFESTGYANLGAHVDDSTASQMYNNIEDCPIAIQAVDQTRGLIPIFEDQIIDARFFSTSCGYTANFHETWSIDDVFPSSEIPYLTANPQFIGDSPSIYNEENFRAFINQKNLEGYDRFSPYFRWSLTMKREQIEAALQKNLALLQEYQPSFILTRDKDDSFSQQPIPDDLGQLQNITPISRGHGGNIIELEITTTSGIYRIIKELNIRQLLKPINLVPTEKPIEIERYDGSLVEDFAILPSTFFYMDITRDNMGNLTNVSFTGGGYGHGVGMSQYGAYGLSLLGKSYIEIIEHYYPGTELYNMY